MSLKPGIGRSWYDAFKTDVYPNDYFVVRGGIKTKPPKYFDRLLEKEDPEEYEWLKYRRGVDAEQFADGNTPARLEAKATVTKARLKTLQRDKV